jgi:ABC-type nickel/cobalt efflux system permease component RcnA
VHGLDELISGLSAGDSLLLVLGVALLLGIRHSADPDHLIAVSAIVAAEENRQARRAAWLGLSWGAGHAISLSALGLPVILLHRDVPAGFQQAAEIAVGLVMVILAVRLLQLWRRGQFHVHAHEHGGRVHRHLHFHLPGRMGREHSHEHEHAPSFLHAHDHAHGAARLIGSPSAAGLMGALQGAGGSAAVVVLLLASVPERGQAAVALFAFAAGTALSMSLLTAAAGYALGRERLRGRMHALVPGLAAGTLVFGAWYAAAAI